MRFKNSMMLFAGCVTLLALSIPAFSRPAPHGVDHKQRTQSHHADQKKKVAQRAPNGRLKPHAAREDRAARLVSMPIAETPKQPILGWPVLVSEARKYLGTNPTARSKLWCATFMNLVLAKVGYVGTNSDAAKSFTYYGHRISAPQIGAIAVLSRGKRGGHVGVVSGIDKQGNPIIISGNHGHEVGEAIYPRSRVIAYVMPSDHRPVDTEVADRDQPNRSSPEHGIESPITELLAAIEAEQSRSARPIQPPRLPQPVEPYRAVEQMPEQTTVTTQRGRRVLPLDPSLAEFLGITDRAQAAPPPREAPQRQRQVQQNRPSYVAHAATGIAGAFGLR